jgi:hypothetical protein
MFDDTEIVTDCHKRPIGHRTHVRMRQSLELDAGGAKLRVASHFRCKCGLM